MKEHLVDVGPIDPSRRNTSKGRKGPRDCDYLTDQQRAIIRGACRGAWTGSKGAGARLRIRGCEAAYVQWLPNLEHDPALQGADLAIAQSGLDTLVIITRRANLADEWQDKPRSFREASGR